MVSICSQKKLAQNSEMPDRERIGEIARGLGFLAFVIWFILLMLVVFDGDTSLVKPCADIRNDDDMWRDCVDYYMDEGWTYQEILEGVVVENK